MADETVSKSTAENAAVRRDQPAAFDVRRSGMLTIVLCAAPTRTEV